MWERQGIARYLYRVPIIFSALILFASAIRAQVPVQTEPSPRPQPVASPQPVITEPPAVASGFKASIQPLPSVERVGVDVTDSLPLTLNEAIRLALENNNDIDSSRVNVEKAEFDLTAARGAYDPVFSSESYFERRETPVSSLLGGGGTGSLIVQKDLTGTFRVGGFSPRGGGSYQLDFSSRWLTTTDRLSALSPQYPTSLNFSYTQPLMRGRSFDERRHRVEIAKKNLSLTDAQFRQRAIEVITGVQQAYWDHAFALRNLQVQSDAVQEARTQLESNRRRVEQGSLAPIDIVEAETQVANFEQNVYLAQEGVMRAENALKMLVLPDRGDPLWSRALLPVSPVNLEPPRISLADAVGAALSSRSEVAQVNTSSEINGLNTRYFRNQAKPQVDLFGSYSSLGLAGTAVPTGSDPITAATAALQQRVDELSVRAGLPPLPPPATFGVSDELVGGYGQSLTNLFQQNYPTFRLGVRITLPFKNRTAEANLGRTLAERRGIKNQRAQLEQLIEVDVRNAIQALRSGEARLAAAASGRETAEKQYLSEQRKFETGSSTVFLVFERQTRLVAARGRELQAQTDLNKAIAEFQRATGSTFEANSISVVTDAPARDLRTADTFKKESIKVDRDRAVIPLATGAPVPPAEPSASNGHSVGRKEQ